MLQLTPFEETASFKETFQEKLKEERIQTSIDLIRLKFSPAKRSMDRISADLKRLDLESLKSLIREVLALETLKELNAWIDARLLEAENGQGRGAGNEANGDKLALN